MSLLDESRDARVIAPDTRSNTEFEAFVRISPEALDALVELADAVIAAGAVHWAGDDWQTCCDGCPGCATDAALERLRR